MIASSFIGHLVSSKCMDRFTLKPSKVRPKGGEADAPNQDEIKMRLLVRVSSFIAGGHFIYRQKILYKYFFQALMELLNQDQGPSHVGTF